MNEEQDLFERAVTKAFDQQTSTRRDSTYETRQHALSRGRRRRATRALGSLALVAVISTVAVSSIGSLGIEDNPRPVTEAPTQKLLVSRDDPMLPSGCSAREMGLLFMDLANAVTEGDTKTIDTLFSMETDFASVGIASPEGGNAPDARTGPDTNDRSSLVPFFQERRSQGEKWTLELGRVHGTVPAQGIDGSAVRVEIMMERSAQDFETHTAFVWGNVSCLDRQIYVLNVGPIHPAGNTDTWCPENAGPDEAVFCSASTQGGSLVFPTQDEASGMESSTEGKLVRRGRCLVIGAARPSSRFMVIWPPGFSYERTADRIVILDAQGHLVAKVGSRVSMGGGTVGRRSLSPAFKEQLGPCKGPYWIASYLNQ